MDGIDPYAFMQSAAGRVDALTDPADLNRMLDDLEYLYEAMDPELQSLAEGLMDRVRERLAGLRRS
jgi:hypothetical protein